MCSKRNFSRLNSKINGANAREHQHCKLDVDGGPDVGVRECCIDVRLLVSPISDPLLSPGVVYFRIRVFSYTCIGSSSRGGGGASEWKIIQNVQSKHCTNTVFFVF